jgi:hypothetical protein
VSCARCASPLEDGDIRCAVCALAAPVVSTTTLQTQARVMRCTECQAATAYSADDKALVCAFCGAKTKVEEPVDPVENAEIVLPFLVDKPGAQTALRAWMKTLGFFRPNDLHSASTMDSMHPLNWAAWICSARALVSWAADSNAGARRSAWAPHAGTNHMDWDALCVAASRGITLKEAFGLAPAYDTSRTSGEQTGVIEQFDLQRSAAREIIGDALRNSAVDRLKRGIIPGSTFRKIKVSLLLEALTTRRYALPAWVLTYKYGSKRYRAIVHGQDPRVVVGSAPYSIWKILLVVLGSLAATAAIAAIIAFFTMRR